MSENRSQNKLTAMGISLGIHAILFALLILVVFKTPLPPYPDTGMPGIEVNFGDSEDGMGSTQPDELGDNGDPDQPADQQPEQNDPEALASNSVITQETEDAPEIKTPKEVKKEVKVKENITVKETKKEQPKETTPVVNEKAMFKKKNNGGGKGGNEGETGKPGDQGSPDGSKTSTYHGPGGGSGNTPGGNGPGGNGGSGISFSLAGRKKVQLPVPSSNIQEEGRVVVEIKVDRDGNVVSAKPGAKGSTTTNSQLLEIARKAAMSAKFNADADAAEVQKGSIIYNFILR